MYIPGGCDFLYTEAGCVNGVVDVTDGDTAISDNGFRQILAENQTKGHCYQNPMMSFPLPLKRNHVSR